MSGNVVVNKIVGSLRDFTKAALQLILVRDKKVGLWEILPTTLLQGP